MKASFDMKAARQFQKEKEDRRIKQNRILFDQASKEAKLVINHILTHYNISKIYQWGSLLNIEKFDENSDVDIAIEGLESVSEYFKICSDVNNLCSFPVDLIEMEKIDPIHRDSIFQKGKLVYEKQ
jgi:predicted nucleotidyltransferase